jgi:DNA-binding CsgD family transcriptional regulator
MELLRVSGFRGEQFWRFGNLGGIEAGVMGMGRRSLSWIYVGIDLMVIAERQFDMLAEHYKLSPRQKEIMRYLLSGVLTDREIVKRMRTAGGTVDKQLMRICTKMHARSRTEVLYRFVCEAKDIRP